MKVFAKGFNFAQDGPGNRLVYHIAGCNMHCPWCSNPEGMQTNENQNEYSIELLVAEAVSCKPLFFSGGGVTFTGGEASLCHEELLLCLKKLNENDIHTCIETNGTSPKLLELLEFIDYLIMDFKHYDCASHKKYTGVGNETIKKNFEKNCKNRRQQHIRIPLINGINTDNPSGFAEYFSSFDTNNTVFEFLPYHEYGKDKWTEKYRVENGFITNEILQNFKEVFINHNLKIITT